MTRAQIEAARERVADVLDDHVGHLIAKVAPEDRTVLHGALVSAVLGHPDGKAPRQPASAGRRARRFAR